VRAETRSQSIKFNKLDTPSHAERNAESGCAARAGRYGTCEIFMFVAPLEGWRRAEITGHRTGKDRGNQIKKPAGNDFPNADKIVLVTDNPNTHTVVSLYETFSPEEARRIRDKPEIHYIIPLRSIPTPHYSTFCGCWSLLRKAFIRNRKKSYIAGTLNTIERLEWFGKKRRIRAPLVN
jgi:hypothetical protein